MALDNFDFEMEFANLRAKYPSVTVERAEYFYKFNTNDHTDNDYRKFLQTLSGDEYFFVFDLKYLLHLRCIERLHSKKILALRVALLIAVSEANKHKDDDDGGTSNWDTPLIFLPF